MGDEVELAEKHASKESESMTSVWDNFDVSKITNAWFKLEFVNPTSMGKQRIVEIEDDDIIIETEYWRNVVVCYVLGAHSPFAVLNGYI